MNNLVIKNGAIYNQAGEKQVLEFGNIEQIALIKKHQKTIELLKTEGVQLYPDYEVDVTANVEFECICGSNVYFQTDAENESDIKCFDKNSKKCKCGYHYILSVDKKRHKIVCKLKQNNNG